MRFANAQFQKRSVATHILPQGEARTIDCIGIASRHLQAHGSGAIDVESFPTDHLRVFAKVSFKTRQGTRSGKRGRRRRRALDYSEEELARAVDMLNEVVGHHSTYKIVERAGEVMDDIDLQRGREPGWGGMDVETTRLLQLRRQSGHAMRAHYTRQLWNRLRRERREREARRTADLINRSKVGGF